MGGEQSMMGLVTLKRSASVGRHRGGSEDINRIPAATVNGGTSMAGSANLNDHVQSEVGKLTPVQLVKSTSANPNHHAFSSAHDRGTLTMLDGYATLHFGSEHHVESLDLQGVEWEGYVEKKGHLVRNWKLRYFTLEGNVLSYYESKEDARRRHNLKGRVTITEVKLDNRVKSAHGHDFVFETKEGKHFHLSCAAELDRRVWVHMIEAGIDCESLRLTNTIIYGSHTFQKNPQLSADKIKDVVVSAYYPRKVPFHGDLYGREGLLYYLSTKRASSEILVFNITEYELSKDKKSAMITGIEKIRSKVNGAELEQPWRHFVQFGPHGRIVRLKVDIDPKESRSSWDSFECCNPYGERSRAAVRSMRALSLNLHDFTVYHVIGKGGFGTVVNAKKKSDGQIYALKILEKGKMTKYDIESSFTEMRVAQNVHHPFIAGLRIAFQSKTKLFLGMNYYAGGDLFHHMSKGATCRIAPARARFYTAELILGIHHLHEHDILYRDIKPENVMIDMTGHIALVDFGLAKLHVSNYKGAKTMAGSPQYTAPELLLPKGKRSYGKAADWWSLGVLLYEMTIGKSPFFDSNVERMYKKIQSEELVFPSRPVVSEELKDILFGLLRKDQRKRYGNVIGELLEHKYFDGIDWDLLLQKKVEAPWKPKLSSELDVGYVDSEFTNLDVQQEVSSPTERQSRSKSLAFIEKITKSGKKPSSPVTQDPTFKDFNYFCEDPDQLVVVSDLCGELRATPLSRQQSLSDSSPIKQPPPVSEDSSSRLINSNGTPLSSFVENGKLSSSNSNANGEQIDEAKKKVSEGKKQSSTVAFQQFDNSSSALRVKECVEQKSPSSNIDNTREDSLKGSDRSATL